MPRWAISQPRMHWTLAGNLAETILALEAAAAAGSAGCVCTELAVTGFHHRMPELVEQAALADAEAQLRSACARLGLAAAVGVPSRGEDGAMFNSHLHIDATGREVGRVHKRGLTPSEATFFKAGGVRGWSRFGSLRATSVLCREMLDVQCLLGELRAVEEGAGDASQRVIFWPSYVGASDAEQDALCVAYRDGARELAAELGAWVLQSNWAQGLNLPAARGFGASLVVNPAGEVIASLPLDEPALSVFELGS